MAPLYETIAPAAYVAPALHGATADGQSTDSIWRSPSPALPQPAAPAATATKNDNERSPSLMSASRTGSARAYLQWRRHRADTSFRAVGRFSAGGARPRWNAMVYRCERRAGLGRSRGCPTVLVAR